MSQDPAAEDDLPEQMRVRRDKREQMLAAGLEPYALGWPRTTTLGEVVRAYPDLPPDARTGDEVSLVGRVMYLRDTGKLIFLDLQDWTGRIQLYIGKKQVGEPNWAVSQCFDLGDLIGVEGELKKTRTGELTIFADKLTFLTKSLEPPPDKHHGLTDPELRQRMRYVDLIHGDGVLQVRVAGPLAVELQHLAPQVLERVNTYLGYRAVTQLKLSRGVLPAR